jgi:hypothetical protein
VARIIKSLSTKAIIILVSIITVLVTGISSTLAVIVQRTESITNTFTPGKIVLSQTETAVTNTAESDVAVYVRLAIVVNYQDDSGNVYHEGAVETQDYNVLTTSDWLKGSDGFYYYTKPIAPGYSSTAFPTVAAITLDASNPKLNYNLVTTYVTAGVQASPTEVVNLAWGVTLDANGNITAVPQN